MKNKILAIIASAFALFGCIAPVPVYAEETAKPYTEFPYKDEASNYAIFKYSANSWFTNPNTVARDTICAVTYDGQLILKAGWTTTHSSGHNKCVENLFTIINTPENSKIKLYVYLDGKWSYKTDLDGSSECIINNVVYYYPLPGNRFNYSEFTTNYPLFECSEDVIISSSANHEAFKNGTTFFTAPAPGILEALGRVVKQGAQVLTAQTAGNLKTLVLCGVGCLALLMALATLYRVLRLFLGR